MSFPLLGQSGGGSTDLSAVEASITALQSDVANKVDSTSVYTQAEVNAISTALTTTIANAVALKQDNIGPNDLALTDTASLVSELASKQPLVTTGSLAISDVASLSAQLSSKQPTITSGSLALADTAGLVNALAGKENTLGATIQASTLEFSDVDGAGINTML